MTPTREQLTLLCPRATASILTAIVGKWDEITAKYRVSNTVEICHLLAHMSVETDYFTTLTENLNYSADRLIATWPAHFTKANADQYAHDAPGLAKFIYGSGHIAAILGNTCAEDGWLYRGQGLFNQTGRATAIACSTISGIDFVAYPELATKADTALEAALAFWVWKIVGPSARVDDITKTTYLVTGAKSALAERQHMLASAKKIFLHN
jgi:putative chitinase